MTNKTELEKMQEEMKAKALKRAVKDILWMARRYANGRQTYAPDLFNDAYDILRTHFGDDIDEKHAHDQQGNIYYDISIEHTKDHPYATYGNNEDSQTNSEIKHRKFYKNEAKKNTT